ncbi:MAG: single-stranded-DNA-specific exonuclease RecJ [Candidatus Acetothermia bacterium]|jgi:single-stranded-DNA-specific exonuclease|nr:single-stranded-DNA-specific exonuclease RecJ [Candidatus Acetothermia bacterium]MDH7505288.1 single-stranded-DNA-specific exonuclease RecJ [Candidatus Acetothermia bacterium]
MEDLCSLFTSRRWRLSPPSPGLAEALAARLGCSLALARVLEGRKGGKPEDLLEGGPEQFNPPWSFAPMERAVERLLLARERGERLFIHGDFDVDGISGTALLYLGLRQAGFQGLKVELEDRARGHGLNPEVVKRVIAEGFKLLITVDSGTSDPDYVAQLEEAGVNVIVTDHHQPLPQLPPATAILNPRLESCAYPNKALAGVGVTFQLLRGLYERLGMAEQARAFLDLVMLGTVADLVPLVADGQAENKALVAEGLRLLAAGGGQLGLRTLVEKVGLDPARLTAGEVGYIVAPKVNAANRVGDPRVAFLLLTTESRQRADYLAEILLDYNRDRQVAQDDLLYQAEELIRAGAADPARDKIIILEGKYWNPGIIGLVASDLVERYYRPAILISRGERESRASGRSIPEFDLIASLERFSHLLLRHGGHQMAAGFSITNQNIPPLREGLFSYARERLADLDGPTSKIDALLAPEEIGLGLYKEIQRLAPFGMGNPEPRFLLPRARLASVELVGKGGNHLKCRAQAGGSELECIGFDMGGYARRLWELGEVGLVFKLGRDEWLGQVKVQLELEDFVPAC